MTTIQEIVKILTDAGIEKNEANVEVKLLIEHFCGYSEKDIILGNKINCDKLEIVKEKALQRKLKAEFDKSGAAIQSYRKRLIEAGIIESPRRGELVFAVPYLADYLKKKYLS